jgi:hypothetical protein
MSRAGARQVKFERFTRVKIEESHRLVDEYFSEQYSEAPIVAIPEVTSLALPWEGGLRLTYGQRNDLKQWELNCYLAFRYLAAALPNMRELDLSGWNYAYVLMNVAARFASLERLVLPGCHDVESNGYILHLCRNLRDLNMDGACFIWLWSEGRIGATLFSYRLLELERVSIKGATYKYAGSDGEPLSIPQPWLINFARRAASLRWLRSDLTPENVAMLKRERPDVEFVS